MNLYHGLVDHDLSIHVVLCNVVTNKVLEFDTLGPHAGGICLRRLQVQASDKLVAAVRCLSHARRGNIPESE